VEWLYLQYIKVWILVSGDSLYASYPHIAMSPFRGDLKLQEFKASIPDRDLKDFETLLNLSKIGPETFENTSGDAAYGLSHAWVVKAKDRWLNGYNWYAIYQISDDSKAMEFRLIQ
jgi:hypothetical protein